MNEEELLKKYASILNLRELCLECGVGWIALIDEALAVIKEKAPKTKIVVIKEKFGGMRIQGDFDIDDPAAQDAAWKAIEEAETKSLTTCEYCGKPGEQRRGGWIKTLCDDCHKTPKNPWTSSDSTPK